MFLQRFFFSVLLLAILTFPAATFAQDGGTDVTPPSDVERLSAMPGNSSVHLKWDMATDNTGVTGYTIYYGTQAVNNKNSNKYETSLDVGDTIEYTVTGLKNDVPYYFAVTASDDADNESDYYSPEVNSMPDSSLFAASILSEFGDSAVSEKKKSEGESVSAENGIEKNPVDIVASAPKLVSAEAVDSDLVKVVFSEKVVLPEKDAGNAFVIQDNLALENLNVSSAVMDNGDKDGKTVLIETDEQIPGTEYVLTAGPEVTDSEGNSILSGKEDAALFAGIKGPKEDPAVKSEGGPKDLTAAVIASGASTKNHNEEEKFSVSKIDVMSDTTLVLTFPKEVILSLDPLENFSIYEKDHPEKKLPITIISTNDDGTIVTLTTGLQNDEFYTLELSGIQSGDDELLDEEKTKLDFHGKGSAALDTIPPEDVTKLVARALKDFGVRLNWKRSINSAGDLLEYILYESTDTGRSYGKLLSMSPESTQQEFNGLSPGEHYFKVTAKDVSGNESAGRMVNVRLVETGPGLGLIGLASVVLGRLFEKRKRKK